MDNGGVMITEEDIISFVNVGQEEGVIEEDEKEMIHSIVGFGETTAKEVMTPRTSMTAFEGSKTIDDIWDTLVEDGFSRIPIYEETIDNILRSEEHTSELQSRQYLVCRLLLEK